MSQAFKIVPSSGAIDSVSSVTFGSGAPSTPAIHDSLRNKDITGPLSISSQLNDRHPLEARLKQWEQTQFDAKMMQYGKIYGPAEPIRRVMELEVVRQSQFVPEVVGGPSRVHERILKGNDNKIDWEDIYTDYEDGTATKDFHSELEQRFRI